MTPREANYHAHARRSSAQGRGKATMPSQNPTVQYCTPGGTFFLRRGLAKSDFFVLPLFPVQPEVTAAVGELSRLICVLADCNRARVV